MAIKEAEGLLYVVYMGEHVMHLVIFELSAEIVYLLFHLHVDQQ